MRESGDGDTSVSSVSGDRATVQMAERERAGTQASPSTLCQCLGWDEG